MSTLVVVRRAEAVAPYKTYHFSPDGDDSNSGEDAAHPWQTMGKFNTEKAAGTFTGPNAVLFKRGSVWTNGTTLTYLPAGASATQRLHLGAYGEGAMPFLNVGIRTNAYLNIAGLKMGYEGYAWGRYNTHHMRVTGCVITGGATAALDQYINSVLGFYSDQFYSCEFFNTVFQNDPTNTTGRACLSVVHYGIAAEEMHDVLWQGCRLTRGPRMFEFYMAMPDEGREFTSPLQRFDIVKCILEESGNQNGSWGVGQHPDSIPQQVAGDTLAGAGIGLNGYSRFEDNIVYGAGYIEADGSLNALLEMSGAVHMSVKRNKMYSGEYGGAFLTQTHANSVKWYHTHSANCTGTYGDGSDMNYCYPKYVNATRPGHFYIVNGLTGDVPNYNEIEDNEMHGQNSPYSDIQLEGSHWVYRRNLLVRRKSYDIWNAQQATIEDSEFVAVSDEAMTPSTTVRALTIGGSDDLALNRCTFDSAHPYGIVTCCKTTATSQGAPVRGSTNIHFNGSTYNKNGAPYDVWVSAESTADGTDDHDGILHRV